MNSLIRNWREADWIVRGVYLVVGAELALAIYLLIVVLRPDA